MQASSRAVDVMDIPAAATAQASLAGRGILITRPLDQSARLAALVEDAGGRALVFPALTIADPVDAGALHALVETLDRFDCAVFVSPTAAAKGLALVRSRRELPSRLRVAAVGKGTARELHRLGVPDVVVPNNGADSEALLALPEFQAVEGKAIIVFRGAGGRAFLADTLRRRGATVEYAECYRRERPAGDAQVLLQAWRRGEIHATTVTSSEALDNLFALVGSSGLHWLRKTPMFVPHERIAAAAHALEVADVHVTAAGDEALVEALARYFSTTS
jgi:uroporphyrinogen-III synthase